MTVQQQFENGVAHFRAGGLAEAEKTLRQVLRLNPNHADALHLLGLIAIAAGQANPAVDFLRRSIANNPGNASAYGNLGKALFDSGRIDEAIAAWRESIRVRPDFADGWFNLGLALQRRGRAAEAIEISREAVRLMPNSALALVSLANALKTANRLHESIEVYRRTIRIKPDFAEAHSNLGIALGHIGQLDEAAAAYREAIRLKPEYAAAHSNLGNALSQQGEIGGAIAAFSEAVRLQPGFEKAHSNLIFTLHFHPDYGAGRILEECLRWNERHAEPLTKRAEPHVNGRDPDRRLRVGYFSPDFRDHVLAFTMMPVFANHDHGALEIFCYSDVAIPDSITERIRGYADAWRATAGMSDAEIAGKIREDRIDILVDATMHMSNGRPLVFARKPAPVQVAWLAYPGTTGITAMDYRLTDPYLDPVGENDQFYSEESVRLPDSFWCYDPLTEEPAVNELPALKTGRVTFGCLNNFCKINEGVLRLWGRVLKNVPGSRLSLYCPEGSHRQMVLDALAGDGIEADRVEMIAKVSRMAYLGRYLSIDVGLDSFPYNGHTTSLDSFWMGVPVVTLAGQTVAGRAGYSQLSNLGLTELVARTPEQYVEIAIGLAGDLPRLAEIRRTLRPRLERSALMDGPRFVRNLEAAYRRMWRNWCAEGA